MSDEAKLVGEYVVPLIVNPLMFWVVILIAKPLMFTSGGFLFANPIMFWVFLLIANPLIYKACISLR